MNLNSSCICGCSAELNWKWMKVAKNDWSLTPSSAHICTILNPWAPHLRIGRLARAVPGVSTRDPVQSETSKQQIRWSLAIRGAGWPVGQTWFVTVILFLNRDTRMLCFLGYQKKCFANFSGVCFQASQASVLDKTCMGMWATTSLWRVPYFQIFPSN